MEIKFDDGVQYHCDECRCITDEYGYGNHLVRCSREKTHGHDVTTEMIKAENACLTAELAAAVAYAKDLERDLWGIEQDKASPQGSKQ